MAHTAIAMISATTRPQAEACQAASRTTPSSTSTTAIGTVATMNDNSSELPTGVSN